MNAFQIALCTQLQVSQSEENGDSLKINIKLSDLLLIVILHIITFRIKISSSLSVKVFLISIDLDMLTKS